MYKIATHSGQFHLDEVLACFLLRTYIPEYHDCSIFRTRDINILKQCHTVIDVGGVYDPQNNRFDHHQKEFQNTFPKRDIRLSSAGLIYLHFGKEILKNMLEKDYNIKDIQIIDLVYEKIYDNFIKMVDGKDNGVEQYENYSQQRYSDNTGLNSRVARLNVGWCETGDQMQRFEEAMKIVGQEWVAQVKNVVTLWYPARPIVERALSQRKQVHSSGLIIKLDSQCPWKDHIYDLEQEMNIKQIFFVIFQGEEDWRVQAVSKSQSSFLNRVSLKKEWRGIIDKQKLVQASQIDDIIFCHASGFIGGAESYESALRMAIESIQSQE